MNELGRITLIQIANLGVIKYANIRMDKEKIHKVAGKNGSGKSTLINAIRFAFEGKEVIPDDVIRHGTYTDGEKIGQEIDKANIRLETSNGYIIQRIIRKNANGEQVTDLKITKNNKVIDGGPQTFLKSLLGSYRDPQKIASMSSKELFDLLMSNIDLSGLEAKLQEIKLEQQVIRKSIKNLGEILPPELPRPEGNFNLDVINEKLKTVVYINDKSFKDFTNTETFIKSQAEKIASMEKELTAAKEAYELSVNALPGLKREYEKSLSERQELETMREKYIETRDCTIAWEDYDRKISDKERLEKEMELQKNLESSIVEDIRKTVTESPLPMDVKCTEDRKVFINDILWENVETSRRLTEAIKYCASMIPKDGLRLLTIERGESIGTKLLSHLEKELEKNNVELLMEVFSESKDIQASFVIEEGEIMGMSEKPDVTSDLEPDLPESNVQDEMFPIEKEDPSSVQVNTLDIF